jgi:hypothetical protein
MIRKLFYSFMLLMVSAVAEATNEPAISTYTYAEKGGQALCLDVCVDTTVHVQGKRPVLVFSFGGGWETGKRQDGDDLIRWFAHRGYVGVSIDYRLYIHQLKTSGKKLNIFNVATSYYSAILTGVEDLYDATSYIIGKADTWNADTSRIAICGSSAGAINSVMAEYLISNDNPLALSHLPRGFNYAALIPCAGGIWQQGDGEPTWKHKPCACLLYHGTSDQMVPYKVFRPTPPDFGAYGPAFYVDQLKAMHVPYLMHSFSGVDHAIAGIYNRADIRDEMFNFLQRVMIGGEHIATTIVEEDYDRKPDTKTFEDTIREMISKN